MPRQRIYASNAERQAPYRAREQRKSQTLRARVQRYRPPGSPEWTTPQDLFAQLHAEFHFTLDVAAQPENALCERFYTPQDDGLSQPWEGVCWCNPPYGRGRIDRWLQKASESAQAGATVVCLVRVSTSARWWQSYITPLSSADVRFLPYRLKFGGSGVNAPFDSAVVIFRSFA